MEEKVKPITPEEILQRLDEIIPDVIVTAINNLLMKEYRGVGAVTIKQDDILKEVRKLDATMTSKIIFDNKWLDIDLLFEQHGWTVKYDKPAYNENYDSYFTFKPKK